MTIEEEVYSLLGANAGVTALVPASKIRMEGDSQNLARPYIVHGSVTASPIYTMDGLVKLTPWDSYQISCFADAYSTAKTVAIAVVNALTGVHDSAFFKWIDMRRMPFEEDVRVHQVVVDFAVWESL